MISEIQDISRVEIRYKYTIGAYLTEFGLRGTMCVIDFQSTYHCFRVFVEHRNINFVLLPWMFLDTDNGLCVVKLLFLGTFYTR